MLRIRRAVLALAVLAVLAVWPVAAVVAQTTAGTAASAVIRSDPADPAARVPPVVYRSALAPEPRRADPAGLGWRDSNELVSRIGGWRQYAREAAAPAAAVPAAPGASGTAGAASNGTPRRAP